MKRLLITIVILSVVICACTPAQEPAQIAATTLPVYEFTSRLCQDTGITVTRLITESVSCLHDYTLQVSQMRALEAADLVIINGARLEDFMEEALASARQTLDASAGIDLLCPGDDHGHNHDDHGHHHENDPHIWLSPVNAAAMARNICNGLTEEYPEYADTFANNLDALLTELETLDAYGKSQLSELSCRDLVTFHDGFAYLAEAFGLHILEAVEEESGSEAPASELIRLVGIVENHELPAIFIETNGSTAAAQIIASETGVKLYTLDMAMAGNGYFETMYRNIDTIKEALG